MSTSIQTLHVNLKLIYKHTFNRVLGLGLTCRPADVAYLEYSSVISIIL